MAKKKNPLEWHLNFAEWSFDNGDKYGQGKPTIALDFATAKSNPRSSDDPSPRERALGAFKRFNLKFGGPDAYGNRVEPPLSDLKVLVVGEGKIRRLAEMVKSAETPAFDEYLKTIPANMGGKGPKWSREKIAREEEKARSATAPVAAEFQLDGNPPAEQPRKVLTLAQKRAMDERLGRKPSLEEQRAQALRHATTPEAIDRINESFERRMRMHEGETPVDTKQPELAPAPQASWAERVKGDALRMPLEPLADAPYKHGEIAAAAVEAITIPIPIKKGLPSSDKLREQIGMPAADPVQLTLTGDDLLNERIQMIERKRVTGNRTRKPKEDTLSGDFWADAVSSPAAGDKTPGSKGRQ